MLRFCDVVLKISNASSAVHRLWPTMPSAWSITARHARACCKFSDISARTANVSAGRRVDEPGRSAVDNALFLGAEGAWPSGVEVQRTHDLLLRVQREGIEDQTRCRSAGIR
jgi:hypothetical protein